MANTKMQGMWYFVYSVISDAQWSTHTAKIFALVSFLFTVSKTPGSNNLREIGALAWALRCFIDSSHAPGPRVVEGHSVSSSL